MESACRFSHSLSPSVKTTDACRSRQKIAPVLYARTVSLLVDQRTIVPFAVALMTPL